MKKDRISKSFSFVKTPELVEWINAQSNISRSIRCLIQQSLSSHGGRAVDVSVEHEKMVNDMLNQNRTFNVNSSMQTQVDNTSNQKTSLPSSPNPEKSKIGFNTFASSKETVFSSLDSSEIPEEYF